MPRKNSASHHKGSNFRTAMRGELTITSVSALTQKSAFAEQLVSPTKVAVDMAEIKQMSNELGDEFHEKRLQEKTNMQGLNTQLADFIKKVHTLQKSNKELEIQIEQRKPTNLKCVIDMYEEELARLRHDIDGYKNESSVFPGQINQANHEIEKLENEYNSESKRRHDLEDELDTAHHNCDAATKIRAQLENEIDSLEEEIEFLNKVHHEEIMELQRRLRNTEVRIDTATGPDLDDLLERMRHQYEAMNKRNNASTELIFKQKVSDLQVAAAQNNMALQSAEDEMKSARKELQSIMLEMKNLRSTNESLKRNLSSLEDRSNRETEKYQSEIRELKDLCYDLKKDMAEHLRQYQHLQGVKVALDMEMSMYQKLLDGEEHRLDSYVDPDKESGSVLAIMQSPSALQQLADASYKSPEVQLARSPSPESVSSYSDDDEYRTEKTTLLTEMAQLLN